MAYWKNSPNRRGGGAHDGASEQGLTSALVLIDWR